MAANVTWNVTKIDGRDFLVVDVAKLRIPLDWDPSSNVFIAIAAPTGGIFNYPVLGRGDDGVTPDIDTVINLDLMETDDPTADYASFTKTGPTAYKLNLGMHKPEKGEDGNTVLDPGDFSGAAPFKIIRLNAAGDAFVLASEKVGDSYYPATIVPTPSGNPSFTLATVSVPPQDFDWRPDVSGQSLVAGTGADVAVNLVARLETTGIVNGETAGNIVGQFFGLPGLTPPTHVLVDGPPPGQVDGYDKVLAGNGATLYLRAERRSGTQTFTTSASTTSFKVKVRPCP